MWNPFKRTPKEKLDYLGYYDSKPYHYFKSNMTYAKDIEIWKAKDVNVYVRFYKGSIFMFVFVEEEKNYDPSLYTYEALKDKIDEVIEEEHTSLVHLTIFKNKNEASIAFAKEPVVNTKKEFHHTFVFDSSTNRLTYYRPIPDFYRLYHNYLEAIYFDLAAIDKTR